MVNRYLILIIGVLLGIIIGSGIFWYLSGFSGKNIFIVNQHTAQHQDNKLKQTGPELKKEKILSKVEKQPELANEITETDSLSEKIVENSDDKKDLKIKSDLLNDTTLLAYVGDSAYNNSIYEEQIVVKKDELLSSKIINLIDLTQNKNTTKLKKDSLIQVTSGIKEPEPVNTYIIEFWKSPINYKGYKIGRNKLIIFGLQETGNARLFSINNQLYLKNFDRFYKIQKGIEFQSFELITDPEILNLLNQ
ncbi:MAG: hypothetical protein M3Q58_08410 [Bacteroidota bacterium]|nr:hypothetical protein [Bacteroidota bacterium]